MMARPVKKPRWTDEEDRLLFECRSQNPNQSWEEIAKLLGLNRTRKSCWERCKNRRDPNVKREKFSQEEDDSIICFQSLYGNSWTSIAAHLPGRTDNDVKNRWYNHLKKKQLGKSTLVSASQEIASTWSTSELASLESEFMPTEEFIKFWFA